MSEHKAKSNIQPLTAADFLRGILGEPEPYDLPGVGRVVIRPLTSLEAEKINAASGGDNHALMRASIALCLVEPKLTDEQIETLGSARAGAVTALAMRILEISGMGPQQEISDLAGGGS